MKRTAFLTTLLFLLSISVAAQDLETGARISIDLNLDARATYEALAQRSGLNVVFAGGYTPGSAKPFTAAELTPREAFDRLAQQTATFWTPFDAKTILVAEDNPQNRKNYERQFVNILPVSSRPPSEAVNELRAMGFGQVSDSTTGVLIRDTAERIRVAAGVSDAGVPAPVFDLDDVFLTESGKTWRTPQSRSDELKTGITDTVSINVNQNPREIYQTLAKGAGVNVLFGSSFRPADVRFSVNNVGFFDALDLLALTTNSFWQPLNESTFLVVEDTVQNRRDVEAQMAETIYLPPETTGAQFNEIVNALRGVLTLRGVYQFTSARAIVLRATPAHALLAETLAATISGASIRKEAATDARTMFSETGRYFHTSDYDRNGLASRTREPANFSFTGDSRKAFEDAAAAGGLQVLFGKAFRPQPVDFSVDKVDVVEALDLLALQSATFWRPLDARTILVMDDTPQNRRDFDPHLVKTIYLPREISITGLNETMNVLRTAFSLRGIFQAQEPRAILIHDIPQRVALVEAVVNALNLFPSPIRSVQIRAPRYAETRILGNAAVARSALSLIPPSSVSINLNQDARATYEALADICGIQVTFSPDFTAGNPQPFHLEGVDPLDAIDYFSLLTQNAWRVVNDRTILVFPDTQPNRVALEPQVVKTFPIANVTSASTVNGILNAIRVGMSIRNAQAGDSTIVVQDTPQRMMVVEKVIESLDRLPMAPENPERVTLNVVLSAYRGDTQIRTESHALDLEVGGLKETLKTGDTISVQFPSGTVPQQVGIQIDAEVGHAPEGRYLASYTITKRETSEGQTPSIPQRAPSIPLFTNYVAAGSLLLSDGETARISGTDIVRNETWHADVTLVRKSEPEPSVSPSSMVLPKVIPVKVQFVVTRGEGDQKISTPFTIFTATGRTSSLRIGSEVPVSTPAPNGQPPSVLLSQFGTQIDFQIAATDDGRFRVSLTLTQRVPSSDPEPPTLIAPYTVTVKDGETAQFAAQDNKGNDFTIDMTLTVLK